MNSQEKRSLLCPNCRRLISADEPACPYCGLSHPGSRWKDNFWTRGFLRGEQFIGSVIILNVVLFILSVIMSPGSTGFAMNPFSFLSPGGRSLLLLGATGTIPIDQLGRWWTLLTANYLHGSILHIIFNMLAFKQIAPLILQEYGGYRTVSIMTLSGVGGYVVSYMAGIQFTIGFSAALCGLIGAAIYYGKSRGGYYGQVIYREIGGWALGILVFGFLFPGINNWAHGGGFLCGALAGFLLGYQERQPENVFHKTVAMVCTLATLGALAWGVGSAFLLTILG